MSATRSRRTRTTARRVTRTRKPVRAARSASPAKPVKSVKPIKVVTRLVAAAPVQVLFRLCKPGWAVTVEMTPNAQGTRFVCPFCPVSHRVPGPVRGFKKLRRAQWVKCRRVEE